MRFHSAAQRPAHRRGFGIAVVLLLVAMITGLVFLISVYTGELARKNHSRAIEAELRQLIDSGAAYARLNYGSWAEDGELVTLDVTHLLHGDRTGRILVESSADPEGATFTVTATITRPRGHTHRRTVRFGLP